MLTISNLEAMTALQHSLLLALQLSRLSRSDVEDFSLPSNGCIFRSEDRCFMGQLELPLLHVHYI